MSAKWPGSVATDADLYVAVNALATTLGGTITDSITTIPLTSTTGFPTAGGVTIDQEVVFYTGVSGGNLTGCTRGADGTANAAHTAGVPVSHTVIAFHHNGLMAEIEALETYLNSNAFLPSGGGTMTGALVLPVGSVTVPSLTFTGDLNTGIYKGAADSISICGNGANMAAFSPTEAYIFLSGTPRLIMYTTNTQFADKVHFPNGTASLPALTFETDPDTGIYHADTNVIGISTANTLRLDISTTAITSTLPIVLPDGTVGAPSLTFVGDLDTGFYHGPTGGDTYLAANGNLIMRFRDGGISVHLSTSGGSYEQSFYFQDDVFAPLGTTRNLGTATTYWNNIHYKTLVKQGGFGYFDTGVELQDGSIVSDLEAIAQLKEDPEGRKTPYGTTWIDPTTLPKLVYIPPPEDSIDDVHGEDVHAMMSIMIGALKEANARIKKLEAKLQE